MDSDAYPEWSAALAQLAASSGVVLVVGASDAGKTTFCTLLAAQAHRSGRSVAVVDADIGQSEIGPPACVGAGRVHAPPNALSDIRAERLVFVGATSPRDRALEQTTATRVAVDAMRSHAPDLIVVDTTGYIAGVEAQQLKQAKIDLLAPSHLVLIQRGAECEPLARSLLLPQSLQAHTLSTAKAITRKPSSLRKLRRAARFARYFERSSVQTLDLEGVVLAGAWLGSGAVVEPRVRLYLERTLGAPVLHAETANGRLCVVTKDGRPTQKALDAVTQDLHVRAVTLTPVALYKHLVVGLTDGEGATLGIGLIDSLDFRRMQIGIRTPVRAQASVRGIRFGVMYVLPDGTELGAATPGTF